ncbi:MAG: hypothetical protein M1819_002162 [Sarea resinae]|nr:MAG: hypothetical protein M1819_002162 [Sarea resinae]
MALMEYHHDQDAFIRSLILLPSAVLLLLTFYLISLAIYNVWFHPLASFPGPKAFAASRIPYLRLALTGRLVFTVAELHDRYGDVVRIGPDELSFINPTAWKDIYGHRQGHLSFQKDPMLYNTDTRGARALLSAFDADHTRMRRLLSHAFSEKALKEQEPVLQSYADLMIDGLHKQVKGAARGRVDIVKWYNWTTFDVIGDLSFGEPFNCLKDSKYHPWVSLVFDSVKSGVMINATKRFPKMLAKYIRPFFVSRSMYQKRLDHDNFSRDKVDRRMAMQTDRKDFLAYILRHNDEKGMKREEIYANAALLILAGSETTATLLSGVTYHLLKNPETLKTLVAEIRGAFTSDEDIHLAALNELKYLRAVLQEGLRMYPPVPGSMTRRVPPQGDSVCGLWVPGNTAVSVPQYACFHSDSNFHAADSFMPERWLPSSSDADSVFAGDSKTALQPFSVGPRNCIGKNLALSEMRLLLSKLLFHFDMQLERGTACVHENEIENEKKNDDTNNINDWVKSQTIYTLWQKGPLMVRLSER